MRLAIIALFFNFFGAKASIIAYDHTQSYAANYEYTAYDLTIDSPYTWYFISYNQGGTTTDVQVIFNVANFPTRCRMFSRTYHLTGNTYTYDTAVQSGLAKILDVSKQYAQKYFNPVLNPLASYPDYTGKIIDCAVNAGSHDPTVVINAAIGYGRSNTPLDTFTIDGQHGISCSLSVKNWIDSNVVFYPQYTDIAVVYAHYTHALEVVCSNSGQAVNYFYYPSVQIFVPLGSNSHIQLFLISDSIPNAITSAATNGSDTSTTAYGNGLEFIDNVGNPSSFSNGTIAGKMLYIYQHRNKGWWDARYAARMTADRGGTWSIKNGYGIINVTAAINYNGIIPACPYPTF